MIEPTHHVFGLDPEGRSVYLGLGVVIKPYMVYRLVEGYGPLWCGNIGGGRVAVIALGDTLTPDQLDLIAGRPYPVPKLDARTAHAVTGFLHWTVIALHRVARHWDAFEGLYDAQTAAETAERFMLKGGHPDTYTELPEPPEYGGGGRSYR